MPKVLQENTSIKKQNAKDKIFCQESYAQELYDRFYGIEIKSKDVKIGQSIKALDLEVLSNGEIEVHTDAGIDIYLDMRKEKKYFEAIGITDFSIENMKRLSNEGVFKYLFKQKDEFVVLKGKEGAIRGTLYDSHLSYVRREFMKQITEQKNAYTAKVISKNQGGFFITVAGVDAFLPGSLAAANKIVNFETYIGKEICVMVEDYLSASDTFIFSYKKYLEKILPARMEALDRTQKHTGIVTGVSKYGVFVEFEEIFTGLLHSTEMTPATLEKFNAYKYCAGDSIELWVKDIKGDKLILTEIDPALKVDEMNIFKEKMEGTVRSMKALSVKPFGIFFEVEKDMIGLLSLKELRKMDVRVEVGESYPLCIATVDPETNKIYLTAIGNE